MAYFSGKKSRPMQKHRHTSWKNSYRKRAVHKNSALFAAPRGRGAALSLPAVPWKKLFLGAAFLSWIGLIVYLPFFRIRTVTVSGTQLLKKDQVSDTVTSHFLTGSSWWPKNNYFVVSANTIADYLKETYTLSSAQVEKIFPNALDITVEEKVTSIIYDNGTSYMLMGQKGDTIRTLDTVGPHEYTRVSKAAFLANFDPSYTASATSSTSTADTDARIHIPKYLDLRRTYGLYPVVYQIPDDTTSTTTSLRPEVVNGIIEIYNQIEKRQLAIPNYVVMGDPAGGAALVSNRSWKIYFMPDADIMSQLDNAQLILQNNKPTEYIDVRYGDHVYWR